MCGNNGAREEGSKGGRELAVAKAMASKAGHSGVMVRLTHHRDPALDFVEAAGSRDK